MHDFLFALRQLRRSPGFALTAVLTLALGVGANTAIFSLLDQALLRALPVRAPQQLVVLEGTGKAWEGHSGSYGGDKEAYFSYPMYRDLESAARTHGLQDLLATTHAELSLTFHGVSRIATGELVSGNYFSLLGTQPSMGRLLTPSDDTAPGSNPVAVLAFSFWQNQLAADPTLVGQTLSVNGHPFLIVGIAAPGFHSAIWGETPALFLPMSMLDQALPGQGGRLTNHKDRWLNILGRLMPGQTAAQAQAAFAPLWHALRAEELKALGTRTPSFISEFLTNSRLLLLPGAQGFSYQRDTLRTPLLAVTVMAALVLLIAAVNVGSLLLVRSAGRLREFSVRAALGATSGRLVSQLLTEGLLIGALGGLAGLALAPAALRVLVHLLTGPDDLSAFSSTLDARVLLFNFTLALAVSLFFSLAPALPLLRPDLTNTLRGSTSNSGSLLGPRRVIVCLQIGLSVVLLVASGLFVRTMQKLRAVDVGFNPQNLVGFSIAPRLAGYKPEQYPALVRQIATTLTALPGVQSLAVTDAAEFTGDSHGGNISIQGYTPPPDQDLDVQKTHLNPNFFAAMQVPLLTGRAFTPTDDLAHPLVAIVNQDLARRYFGSPANALGKRIMDGASNKPNFDTEIVGVVPDFKQRGIRDAIEPTVFLPMDQLKGNRPPTVIFFYLRTPIPAADMARAITAAMHQIDPILALDNLRTIDIQIDQSLANDRLITFLAVAFGILALLLAGIGLYGVLAFSTAQRTREIGIRMALGSSRLAVSSLILADVFRLAALGVALAIPAALALGRLLRAQLFGVSAADPLILTSVIALIALVAFLAALLPAHHAASVEPTQALRAE